MPLVGVIHRLIYSIIWFVTSLAIGKRCDDSQRVTKMLRAIQPRAISKYTLFHAMGFGVPFVLLAYFHLMFSIWSRNILNLTLMTCGVWTDDLLEQYNILERADAVASRNDSKAFRTHHEEVCVMTAKLRSLYWFTLPGMGCLAKMSGAYVSILADISCAPAI
jgi:hypothetical protein